MFLRFCAILLFGAGLIFSSTGHADTFVQHFTALDSPRPLPMLNFTDDKGRSYDLTAYRGRVILLNIWATWCGPCRREMPSLNALRGKFDTRQLDIVAVVEDRDGLAAAQSFYKHHNIQQLPVYIDASGQLPSILHIHGLPTTLLIDANGNEIGRVEGGADWTAPDTLAFLETKIKAQN